MSQPPENEPRDDSSEPAEDQSQSPPQATPDSAEREGEPLEEPAQPWRQEQPSGLPQRLEHGIWHAPRGPLTKIVAVVALVVVFFGIVAFIVAAVSMARDIWAQRDTWPAEPNDLPSAEHPEPEPDSDNAEDSPSIR